jgi:hypothetical protein
MKIGAGIAVVALIGAGIAWFARPSFSQEDDRLQDRLRADMSKSQTGAIAVPEAAGSLICTLQPDRSRVIGPADPTVPLDWKDDGCVNGRTQYGLEGGTWTRVLAPTDQSNVAVNSYDPSTGEYRMDRYLLRQDQIDQVRKARTSYQPPACGAGNEAAIELGADQAAVLSLLPAQPNERLVYSCSKGNAAASVPPSPTPSATSTKP